MSRRTVLGIGIAAAALTVLAPGAQAATVEGGLSFGGQSYVAKPGGTVPLDGWCTDPAFTAAVITSPVLNSLTIAAKDGADGKRSFAGTGHVKKSAKSGVYQVAFTCGGKKIESVLTVHVPGANDNIKVDPGQLKIFPGKAVAGHKVTLWWHAASCGSDVTVTGVRLAGGARAATVIEDEMRMSATAIVPSGTKPGTHTVTVSCAGAKLSAKLTVVARTPVKASVTPKGAPETGGGPVS
ncbi:hypothetical protein [Alloactinosynnema sp. L-07]|uniref:hypothetical protein n=1 Tax=Alloactinosynnema sp. L-07 TaxID=1653480 RepID=UPI00065F041D|nr:hypothetical protein [Alloactinosynnema sp. L-07]CRK56137.1 hypothetical protein [Alloactinosynnema sp. L-07]